MPAAAREGQDPPAVVAREVQDLIRKGQELELEERWSEALTHYEDAYREHPQVREFEQGMRYSRIHYDLGRRYGDSSFRQQLLASSERVALDLYAEVLLMVQSHYVDKPNWKQILERGLTGFDVALTSPTFAKHHLADVPEERVDAARMNLRTWLLQQKVTTRHDAREIVAGAARYMHRELGLSSTACIVEFTCGAANSLDEYSSFLTGDQLEETYAQIEGNFVGLGVELKSDEGSLLIVKVISRSPAEKAGIKAGDHIVAVNRESIVGMDTDAAADKLQGPEGTSVDVTVVTAGLRPRVLKIVRAQVDVPSVDDIKVIDPQFGVAYLKLTCFQKTTSRDLDKALLQLQKQGMKSLIIDLRGNPGGLLTASVDVADKFVERGTIVSTRGRIPAEQHEYQARVNGTWKMPLVLLIDGDSASASEILAGCIRDNRRGTIVGTRSYGKGSVQGIFSLDRAKVGLRLTTSRFYSPNGHPFSKIGVEPDVVVRTAAKPIDGQVASLAGQDNDLILQSGIDAARQRMARR